MEDGDKTFSRLTLTFWIAQRLHSQSLVNEYAFQFPGVGGSLGNSYDEVSVSGIFEHPVQYEVITQIAYFGVEGDPLLPSVNKTLLDPLHKRDITPCHFHKSLKFPSDDLPTVLIKPRNGKVN